MKDSCTLVADTLHQLEQLAPDTSTVCVAGTTVVSVADMPGENQPNGWWQLGASVIIPLICTSEPSYEQRFCG